MNSYLAWNTGKYIHELDNKRGKSDSICRCVLEMVLRTHSVKQVRFLVFNNLTEIKISGFNTIYPLLYKEVRNPQHKMPELLFSFGKTPAFWNPHTFQLQKFGLRQLFYQIPGTAELIGKHMVAHNKVEQGTFLLKSALIGVVREGNKQTSQVLHWFNFLLCQYWTL